MAKVSAHVYVYGMVQGVFFRYNTKRMADLLGVSGWVKNLPDGRVEAYFEGEEDAVRRMVEWCHVGPPLARVERVEVEWGEYTGRYRGFTIRY